MNTIVKNLRIAAVVAVASLLTLTPVHVASAETVHTAGAASAAVAASTVWVVNADVTPTDQCATAALTSASQGGTVDWAALNSAIAACYGGSASDGVGSVWTAIISIF